MRTQPNLSGTVQTQFTIGPMGTVVHATASGVDANVSIKGIDMAGG